MIEFEDAVPLKQHIENFTGIYYLIIKKNLSVPAY